MSVERRCKLCGAKEGIRINFSDYSEEIRFHMDNDGKCMNFKSCEIKKINS